MDRCSSAALSDDGTEIVVVADLETFWSAPESHLAAEPAGPILPADAAEMVPPVLPGARVVCVGLNYQDHVNEGSFRDAALPEFPTLFARWPTSLSVGGAEIPIPSGEDGLDWEGEVMAWVGSPLVDATAEEALAAVVGYSAFNDITSRRAQKLTSQWIIGKNGDQLGPGRADGPRHGGRRSPRRPPARDPGERRGRAAQQHGEHDLRRGRDTRTHLEDVHHQPWRPPCHGHARRVSATLARPRGCCNQVTWSRSRSSDSAS